MVAKLVVLAAIVTAVTAIDATTRGNIALGDTFGAHLIYHEVHEKYAIPFIVRDEDVKVEGVGNEIIKAIVVNDLNGDGKSYITSGGLGRHNVTIKLESERGSGYKFLVQVYAI